MEKQKEHSRLKRQMCRDKRSEIAQSTQGANMTSSDWGRRYMWDEEEDNIGEGRRQVIKRPMRPWASHWAGSHPVPAIKRGSSPRGRDNCGQRAALPPSPLEPQLEVLAPLQDTEVSREVLSCPALPPLVSHCLVYSKDCSGILVWTLSGDSEWTEVWTTVY